jgi:hypothetical protein
MTRLLAILSTAVVLALCPRLGQAAVTMVVVEAHGLKLQPGDTVDGSITLALQEGQQLTLIAPTGQIVKLKGPSDAPPLPGNAAGPADVKAALNTLITQKVAMNERAGVVRGTGSPPVPPDPWLLDVTHVGNRCLPADQPMVLWRPAGTKETNLVITPSDRSWQAKAIWPEGADRLTLPNIQPLARRTAFLVRLGNREVGITLIAIPASLTNDAMRAAWMEESGCDTQAEALLKAAQGTGPPAGQQN